MTDCTLCTDCESQMLHIPIRKIDGLYMVEDYCPCCETSTYRYEPLIP